MNDFTSQTDSPSLYIVDDERELLASLADSLRAMGYSPKTFERPSELLNATCHDDIGCVITDLRMPGMGGLDLLHRLNDSGSCLSVILLTAFADVPTAVEVMKHGAATVVEKPFDLRRLADEIESAMMVSEQSFARQGKIRRAVKLLGLLSVEEIAVLDLAIGGIPNRQIAESLSTSPRTVDRRRHTALRKLQAETVADYAVLKTLADYSWL
ncbi:response regulator [Stieleria sp. TO1_6]|nr:response regulator [Stieleria tagensis]